MVFGMPGDDIIWFMELSAPAKETSGLFRCAMKRLPRSWPVVYAKFTGRLGVCSRHRGRRNPSVEWTLPSAHWNVDESGYSEAEQKAMDQKKRNDRLIAVAEQSLLYAEISHLSDLIRLLLKQ